MIKIFTETTDRVRGLDLLRALAVMLVVLYHYPKSPDQLALRAASHYGWVGVDLFFVLSGYLIAGQLFSKKTKSGFRIGVFYLRRFLRTFPNYYIALGLYALVGGLSAQGSHLNWTYFLFLQNFWDMRDFTPSWSLCVEEHFYLLVPLIFVLVKSWRPRNVIIFLCAIFLSQPIIRLLIWTSARPDLLFHTQIDKAFDVYLNRIYYPTYTRLDGLIVGVCLASIKVYRPMLWERIRGCHHRLFVLGFAVLATAALVLHWRMSALACTVGFTLLSLGFGLWVAVAASPESILNRVKVVGVHQLAVLSYAIYLIHPLTLGGAAQVCSQLGFSHYGLPMLFLAITFTLLGAFGMYAGVERVFLKLRDRLIF